MSYTRVQDFDSPDIDAFGNQRVANAHILLSGQLVYADNPLVWAIDTTGGGGGSYSANESAYDLTVGSVDGDESIRQTKRYWLYRAGQSQLHRMTAADLDQVTNIRKRMGYFDAEDGVFFEVNGTVDLALTVRSFVTGSAVDTRVPQTQWNMDRLNPSLGLNPSGMTLDPTKSQQFVTDLQWLGVGRVRAGFDIGGRIIWIHEFNFANVISGGPYMRRASLPVRYEITNTGASAGGSLKQICSAVIREGGDEEEGIPTCTESSISTPLVASVTAQSAISIRLRASHIRAFAKFIDSSLTNFGATGQDIAFRIVLNATLTGGSLSFANLGLGLEVSFTQLNHTTATGHPMGCGTALGGNQSRATSQISIESSLGLAADIAGVGDVISLITEARAGTPAFRATIQMLELF